MGRVRRVLFPWGTLFLALFISASCAWGGFFYPDLRPGYGVTSRKWLSNYFPPLKGTHLDTPIFYMESGKPGATFLVIGGTHGQEIAGYMAATVLIENSESIKGRLILIPFANRSAMSVQDNRKRIPRFHSILSRSGKRYLPYGDRLTDLVDQGSPDPEAFIHPSGHVRKKGEEARNLNRVYPGKEDGTPTQQLAYGIMELIRREKVDLSLDLHETTTPEEHISPQGKIIREGRLAYMLVSHPKGLEIGARAMIELEMDTGITGKLEKSNPAFRGLSHLEIGQATDCLSFLFETPNPGMDRWRETPDVIGDRKYPLENRVGTALRIFKHLADSYGAKTGKEFVLRGLPEYREILEKKVGAFLN